MTNLIHNILSERSIVIETTDSRIVRKIYKGLPQGSVLSPILFNLYCAQIHSVVTKDCKILQYADDIVIYSFSRDIETAKENLITNLQNLNGKLNSLNLHLAPSKCQTVIFTKKRKLPNIVVTIDNMTVSCVKSVRFLGMILDSKLSWKRHIDTVVSSCEKIFNILRAVSRVWWGSHPTTMKLMYNALIRSHLDYGSFILDPLPKYLQKRLDVVQSKSLRLVLGAMGSSPVNVLQVESVDPPLILRREFLSDSFLLRRFSTPNKLLTDPLKIIVSLLKEHIRRGKQIPCLARVIYISLNLTTFPQNLLFLLTTIYLTRQLSTYQRYIKTLVFSNLLLTLLRTVQFSRILFHPILPIFTYLLMVLKCHMILF